MSWFSPPAEIKSTIFSSMPDHFRKPERTEWADANKGGAPVDSFLEGPSFDRAGRLYVTDIPHGRVFRIDGAGDWTLIAHYDGWPNGLKISPNGEIWITDYKTGLVRLDPDSGRVSPVLTKVQSESFRGVNDLVFARNGDAYFTDQGQTGMQNPTGRVYRYTADGRLDCLLDSCPSPNGVALDIAEEFLFVALTRGCQVWRMPVGRDSVICKAGVFAHTPGGVSGPDGLAIDTENGLSICNPGHGCVWRLDKTGVPTHKIVSCAGVTLTNLAFHPTDRDRLYITDSERGHILVADVPFSGHTMASHATDE